VCKFDTRALPPDWQGGTFQATYTLTVTPP